jgi:hypothetical protein
MILFTQQWDIIQGKEDDYAKFVSDVHLPGTKELGLTAVGGYYVEVGSGPRVFVVHSAGDLAQLSDAVATRKFRDLTQDLKSLVRNYRTAIMEPTGRIKRGEYTIQKGVWKLNQYYDLRSGVKKEYADFIINGYIPVVERLDYVELTGGWNVVLGGTSEIIAEFTFKDPVDIGRLLNNEDFRKAALRLRNEYAINYMSRILRCTERFDEPRWFKL